MVPGRDYRTLVGSAAGRRVDGVADGGQDVREGPAEDTEDERRERRGQGQDQAVLDEPLTGSPHAGPTRPRPRASAGWPAAARRPGGARRRRTRARRRSRGWRPGSGSRARSIGGRATIASRLAASTASRASARRSSIIAASAGGRSSVPVSVRRRRPARALGGRARRRDARLELVGDQSSRTRDPFGPGLEVGRQRLVEDAEQAALEIHRQAPVLARASRSRPATPARRPRSRAARRRVGTSPRSSRTIGRTSKMNDLVASSVCWTIATSWRTSPLGAGRVGRHEALDDLGLEHDVGQALGRAVVHRPGDLAAQVLLGAEEQPRDRGRDAARVGHRRGRLAAGLGRVAAAGGTSPKALERLDVGRERVAEATQGPPLALQDVDLRLHQGRALGQQDQLGVELAACPVARRRRPGAAASDGRELLGGRATRRVSCRVASARACATSRSTSPSSLSRRASLLRHLRGQLGQAGRRGRSASVVAGSVMRIGAISPPASGSSPGASRRRRPGSGR